MHILFADLAQINPSSLFFAVGEQFNALAGLAL